MQPEESHTYSRAYLSIGHLKNAAHFTRLTGEIEQHTKFVWGTFKPHDAYAMGAVLSSVAFVEAAVNEVYADAADEPHPSMKGIGTGYAFKMPQELTATLAGLWSTRRWRMGASTLEKYEAALRLAGAEAFDRGAAPYQDVRLLTKLRNALVHFEPTSRHKGDDEPTELESQLAGKFPLNPLAAPPIDPLGNDPLMPFLPHKCLGYGCALWALESSMVFTDEFFSKVGLDPYHGGSFAGIVIDYASMISPEEIQLKHGKNAHNLVERPVGPPSDTGG